MPPEIPRSIGAEHFFLFGPTAEGQLGPGVTGRWRETRARLPRPMNLTRAEIDEMLRRADEVR
jgi:hypothetical protein